MNQPRKPKKVKAPGSFDGHISKGSEYLVNSTGVKGCYKMIDDKGKYVYIRLTRCVHLGGNDWIVTEWEDETNTNENETN